MPSPLPPETVQMRRPPAVAVLMANASAPSAPSIVSRITSPDAGTSAAMAGSVPVRR